MEGYGSKKGSRPKHTIENERPSGIPGNAKAFTRGFKEQIRNANRAQKKTERQSAKNYLRNFM